VEQTLLDEEIAFVIATALDRETLAGCERRAVDPFGRLARRVPALSLLAEVGPFGEDRRALDEVALLETSGEGLAVLGRK